MSNHRGRTLLTGFVCVLTLLLSGCGMDIAEPSSAPGGAIAAATGNSQQTTTSEAQQSTDSEAQTTTTASASTGAVSVTVLGWTTPAPSANSTAAEETTAASTAAETTTTVTPPPAPVQNAALTEAQKQFLNDCVFVGDSICSGLSAYKILSADQVVAKGSIGVRSIFENKFKVNGTELDIITALSSLHPKYVIFSMGMNDINMTTKEQYCQNYSNLLSKVQQALPNAQLCVASITPIDAESPFSTNTKIDTYNQAIQQFLTNYPGWRYLDVTHDLKDDRNSLQQGYSSGDGIHLSPTAYTLMLRQICEQLDGSAASDANT